MVATRPTTDMAARLQAYLAAQGVADPQVSDLRRLTGGSTHETWAFDLADGSATLDNRPLILRRNFVEASLDMSPEVEFRLLRWLHDVGVPVARPWLCEPTGQGLSTPFVISERINGVDLRKAMAKPDASLDRRTIALDLVALQARIHGMAMSDFPAGLLETADARRELARWAHPLLALQGRRAHPLVRAAIAWLEAHVPEAGRSCLVHGDFKANNILWSEDRGAVLLDWELAHIGDPEEDLAWTMLWLSKDDIVAGMLDPDTYVAAYEAASGRAIDRDRLFYWQLFSLVKLSGIMLTGNNSATGDGDLGPSHALLSRGVSCLETAMADYLLATTRRTRP